MVSKYKRKTSQGTWSKDVMQTAINLCRAGESIKGTAREYGLAYATLYRHVKSGIASPQLGRFRSIFTEDEEIEASRLYNMGETGISTTSNKPPNVLSVKGKNK